jgi:hypothetical protein
MKIVVISICVVVILIIKYIIKIHYHNQREIEESRKLREQNTKNKNNILKIENEKSQNINIKNNEKSALQKKREKLVTEKRIELIKELNSKYSLTDLIIVRSIYLIKYTDLLNCFEWKYKRLRIIYRDYGCCRICKKFSLSNHVHHNYYIKDKLPWEIDDNGLVTVCQNCHINIHQTTEIKIYKYNNGLLEESPNTNCVCMKCNGSGYLPQYDYYENGICFECKGERVKVGVFYNALLKTYNNLDEYNDELKRNEYINFISKIDYSLIESLYEIYRNPILFYDDDEDDLPF